MPGVLVQRLSFFHLETAAKLSKLQEPVFAVFFKRPLKSLNIQADFDSAIRRCSNPPAPARFVEASTWDRLGGPSIRPPSSAPRRRPSLRSWRRRGAARRKLGASLPAEGLGATPRVFLYSPRNAGEVHAIGDS
jgi:hypothetical protein